MLDDDNGTDDGSDDVDDDDDVDAVPEAISPDDLASKSKKLFREMPQRRQKRFEPRAVARGKYLSLFLSSRKGKVWFNFASRGRIFEHRQKKKGNDLETSVGQRKDTQRWFCDYLYLS